MYRKQKRICLLIKVVWAEWKGTFGFVVEKHNGVHQTCSTFCEAGKFIALFVWFRLLELIVDHTSPVQVMIPSSLKISAISMFTENLAVIVRTGWHFRRI